MRYWFDTEFIEDGRTIDLISIGIVGEDGRTLYLQNSECDLSRANDFVRLNVLPKLTEKDISWTGGVWASQLWITRRAIAAEIRRFVDPERYGKPEFWGYYAAYDWVVLCQLYGQMDNLPKGWPMHCYDLKQWADALGNPSLPPEGKNEHHALQDARWNERAYRFLERLEREAAIGA